MDAGLPTVLYVSLLSKHSKAITPETLNRVTPYILDYESQLQVCSQNCAPRLGSSAFAISMDTSRSSGTLLGSHFHFHFHIEQASDYCTRWKEGHWAQK